MMLLKEAHPCITVIDQRLETQAWLGCGEHLGHNIWQVPDPQAARAVLLLCSEGCCKCIIPCVASFTSFPAAEIH